MPTGLGAVGVSQRANGPWVQGRGEGWGWTSTAMTEPLLQVLEQGVELPFAPVASYRRHRVLPVADDRLEAVLVLDDRAVGDVRADPARAGQAVALGADALELLLAEVGRSVGLRTCLSGEPAVELICRDGLHRGSHRRVLDPAELCALSRERPRLVHLEPGVVRMAGDGVDLAAERRNPPAVDHVVGRRADVEPDRPADRCA